MGENFWRYAAPPSERANVPRPSFPGYFSSGASTVTSNQPWTSNDQRVSSSDHLQRDILPLGHGGYGVDGIANIRAEAGFDGVATSAGIGRYPSPFGDRSILAPRQEATSGISPRNPEDLHTTLRRPEGPPAAEGESNILFVDGLPSDCSRREVGHLFRPFIGFREIKVVHKEPRHSGDKAMVLCFVEFSDANCALTAMEALQGYKFDDKKADSPVLQIHFAQFPFRLPSRQEDKLLGRSSVIR